MGDSFISDKDIKTQMDKVINFLDDNYKQIHVGRANPQVLDKVLVNCYGSSMPVGQIASISSEARSLIIKPWDMSLLKEIDRAIQKENLGLTPQNNGECIRLNFPPLSEEERVKVSKQVSKMAEDSKVSIRNVRRDFISKINNMKKNKEINDDDSSRMEKKVQDYTNNYVKKIDSLKENKTSQVMEV